MLCGYICQNHTVIYCQLFHCRRRCFRRQARHCCLMRQHAFPFPAAVILLYNQQPRNIRYIGICIHLIVFRQGILCRRHFGTIGHTAASFGQIRKYHTVFSAAYRHGLIRNQCLFFIQPHLCRCIRIGIHAQCQLISGIGSNHFRQFQCRQLHLRHFLRGL